MIAVKGVYDGKVVRPNEPLNVAVDAEVVLVVLDAGHAESPDGDTLRFFGSLKNSSALAKDGVAMQREWRRDWCD